MPCRFVGDERALEGLAFAARERRETRAPEEIHEIECALARVQIGLACHVLAEVEPTASRIGLTRVVDGAERAIVVHGHATVKEQVAVVAGVETALLVEIVDMAVQYGTFEEIRAQISDDALLLLREHVGVRCTVVDGREISVVELVAFAVA